MFDGTMGCFPHSGKAHFLKGKKIPLERENPAGRGHLGVLQLPPGLIPVLLIISHFLSTGEPDLVGLDGDFFVGRSGLAPG